MIDSAFSSFHLADLTNEVTATDVPLQKNRGVYQIPSKDTDFLGTYSSGNLRLFDLAQPVFLKSLSDLDKCPIPSDRSSNSNNHLSPSYPLLVRRLREF